MKRLQFPPSLSIRTFSIPAPSTAGPSPCGAYCRQLRNNIRDFRRTLWFRWRASFPWAWFRCHRFVLPWPCPWLQGIRMWPCLVVSGLVWRLRTARIVVLFHGCRSLQNRSRGGWRNTACRHRFALSRRILWFGSPPCAVRSTGWLRLSFVCLRSRCAARFGVLLVP